VCGFYCLCTGVAKAAGGIAFCPRRLFGRTGAADIFVVVGGHKPALREGRGVGILMFTPATMQFYEEHLADHHNGTGRRCVLLCARLGFSATQTQTAVMAARVHDMGKMFVPWNLLTKAGPLTVAERRNVEQHVQMGAVYLGQRDFPGEIIQAVWSHHERWDGTGYPDGLSGDKIPLLARIISICDAWDAMAAGRHYKKRLCLGQITREIQTGADTGQFSPDLAEAVLDILQQNRRIESVQNRA